MPLPDAVIDTTLLSRLAALGLAKMLPLVFRQIRIPLEVRREAYKASNKKRLRNILDEQNDFFIDCREAEKGIKELLTFVLDEGEAAVIAQAEATNSAVIIDEGKGYKEAIARNIQVFRTGAILCLLKEAGQIQFVAPYLDKLVDEMNFRLHPKTKIAILKQADEI